LAAWEAIRPVGDTKVRSQKSATRLIAAICNFIDPLSDITEADVQQRNPLKYRLLLNGRRCVRYAAVCLAVANYKMSEVLESTAPCLHKDFHNSGMILKSENHPHLPEASPPVKT